MTLARALELAAAADGRAYPKPTVGAVVLRDGEVVGEGATEAGGRHGEIVALDGADRRLRVRASIRCGGQLEGAGECHASACTRTGAG